MSIARRLPAWVVAVAAVLLLPLTAAAPAHAVLASPLTHVWLDSESVLGQGHQYDYTTADSLTFTGTTSAFHAAMTPATCTPSSFCAGFAQVDMAAPSGATWTAGTWYEDVQRLGQQQAGHAGLTVTIGSENCNTLTARFIVDAVGYAPDGSMSSFTTRFEEHCDGVDPAVFGAITWNSTADYRTRSLSPRTPSFTAKVGGSQTVPITITDNGPSPLTPSAFSISGPNASEFAITANTCLSAPLASGGSCTVSVRFSPATSGPRTATLTFRDELSPLGPAGSPADGRDLALTGTTTNPQLTVSGDGNLGDVRVGTLGGGNLLTIANTGDTDIMISSLGNSGGSPRLFGGSTDCVAFANTGDQVAKTLPQGSSCSVTAFAYPNRMGWLSTTLVVGNDGDPLSIPLSVDGTEGYYLASARGGVSEHGDADWYGDMFDEHLNAPIVAMNTAADGYGYWLLGQDGGIFNYGDASFYGSTGGKPLNKPVVGMAPTPTGGGYWLVAADGGIFAYGDARFYGSTGSIHLNAPIVSMAPTVTGHGYWFVAADGGIFNYGDAAFRGSAGSMHVDAPIVGMAATPRGQGYWMVTGNGEVFAYGDAPFMGGFVKTNDVIGVAGTAPPVAPSLLAASAGARVAGGSSADANWRASGSGSLPSALQSRPKASAEKP